MDTIRYLSLEEIENGQGSLWVINNSSELVEQIGKADNELLASQLYNRDKIYFNADDRRGANEKVPYYFVHKAAITFKIKSDNNVTELITVSQNSSEDPNDRSYLLPQDLTTQASRKNIIESKDFRYLISKDILRAISQEDAMKIIRKSKDIIDPMINVDKSDNKQFNPLLSRIMDCKSDTSDDEIVDIINNNKKGLTKEDLQYIIENSTNITVKEKCSALLLEY